MLNDTKVQFITNQKNLVEILDSRLDIIEHTHNKINKCYKIVGVMKRCSLALSIKILLKIYQNYSSFMLSEAKVRFATSQKYLVLILYSRLFY